MHVIIDGDILRYRCGFAAQETWYDVYQGEEKVSTAAKRKLAVEMGNALETDYAIKPRAIPEPVENCLHSVKLQLQAILDKTMATSYAIWLTTDAELWRNQVAVTRPYKGNRDPEHRPFHYDAITKYLLNQWKAVYAREGYEADDDIALEQLERTPNSCVATIDKDLDQVPGWHYNFVTEQMYWITENEADYNFYYQLLMGDSVDNIPGCPGIGAVKAARVLADARDSYELYSACLAAFYKALKDLDYHEKVQYFNEQAQLIRLGIPWSPPTKLSKS